MGAELSPAGPCWPTRLERSRGQMSVAPFDWGTRSVSGRAEIIRDCGANQVARLVTNLRYFLGRGLSRFAFEPVPERPARPNPTSHSGLDNRSAIRTRVDRFHGGGRVT